MCSVHIRLTPWLNYPELKYVVEPYIGQNYSVTLKSFTVTKTMHVHILMIYCELVCQTQITQVFLAVQERQFEVSERQPEVTERCPGPFQLNLTTDVTISLR